MALAVVACAEGRKGEVGVSYAITILSFVLIQQQPHTAERRREENFKCVLVGLVGLENKTTTAKKTKVLPCGPPPPPSSSSPCTVRGLPCQSSKPGR